MTACGSTRCVGRRAVLAGSAGVVGAVALSACGNGPASAGTGAGGSPSASGLAAVSSIPVGGAVSALVNPNTPVVIAQPKAGEVVAFSAVCTHMGCTVVPQGAQYVCPCHGSVYDGATGAVMSGPAPSPLTPFPVKVVKGEVIAKS
jgi:cytochrome b6-f complex iron-sulfur subunit